MLKVILVEKENLMKTSAFVLLAVIVTGITACGGGGGGSNGLTTGSPQPVFARFAYVANSGDNSIGVAYAE